MKKYCLLLFLILFPAIGKTYGIDLSLYRFHTIPANPYYHGIFSIVKDGIGRIWYSGSMAVFMYDGFSFIRMDEQITSQAPDFSWQFYEMFADRDKNLYVTTNRGLFQLDYDRLKFRQVATGAITAIAQGIDGTLWICKDGHIETFSLGKDFIPEIHYLPHGMRVAYMTEINGTVYYSTYNGRIFKLNRKKSEFELLVHIAAGGYIRHLIEYKDDLIVLTEDRGLYFIDQQGRIRKHYPLNFDMNEPVNSKKLYIDALDVLWVGTQLGVQLIDLQSGEQKLLQANRNDPLSLPHNSIWSISPDPDGGVWVGTFGGKLTFMTFNDNHVDYRTATKGGLNNSIVSCFEEDKNGNIYIGTEGGGINFWNRKKDEFTYYTHYSKNTVNFDMIKILRFDSSLENLSIASYNGGINIYNTQSKTFKDLKIFSPSNDTRYLNVYDFAMQSDTGIWISDPENGLYYYSLKTHKTRKIDIANPAIIKMMRTRDNALFLFTRTGLFLFDTGKEVISKKYLIESSRYATNILNCYCVTSSSDLWIGTRGGGVNRFSNDGTYTNLNPDSGFDAKTVFSILEDKTTRFIWLATDNGLIRYDPFQNHFQKIDIVDSRIYGSFYPQSCYQTASGDMLFGGTNGFIVFNPAKIRVNQQRPEVFLSGFFINNKKITTETENSPLPKDISMLASTGKIKEKPQFSLSYKQTNIGIEFSSNSYLEPLKNRFASKLSGISSEWQILPPGQHNIQYSSLPPGLYVFEIKAANNDGIWGEKITSLTFEVKPALWLSVWAYVLYIFVFLCLLYLIWKYFSDKKNFRHKIELEKIEKEKMTEITQMRINFFTNISHDLKTPLTLILDPLKRLEKTLPPEHPGNDYRQLIEHNVRRIQRLISQLLEFRKIESKKINPTYQTGNIIGFTSDLFNLFIPYAKNKHMFTEIDTFASRLTVLFDSDLTEKIFTNLFSNAVKYSPEGESVIFKISLSSSSDKVLLDRNLTSNSEIQSLTFEIINTGVTIPPQEVERLFESFSNLSAGKTAFQESTGLGLSIAKELILALGGAIQPVVRRDEVVFRVIIPFYIVNPEDLTVQENSGEENYTYPYTLSELKSLDKYPSSENPEEKKNRQPHSLVIIEDDQSLKDYLVKELSREFSVYPAKNGYEGIELVKKINPQIVVTDLMMPEPDGFEVCKRLKNNLKTSHIPIIMLSATANPNKRVASLKEGAAVFIEKPFDMDFLIQQIRNLIESRENLKALYSKRYVVEPSQVVITSVDEAFFKKAVAFVEDNIQNPAYDVESFVSDMATSRTLLYRKINHATGMSIKEFILDLRMKRAAQLLKDSHYNVSEIAVMAGYNDSKYFSTCFKKHYGMTPTEFKLKG
jgi:signal transduction histidine kinase/ligand-binding sensor domain-containing protein/DNA-binding response OmpR family regulator